MLAELDWFVKFVKDALTIVIFTSAINTTILVCFYIEYYLNKYKDKDKDK